MSGMERAPAPPPAGEPVVEQRRWGRGRERAAEGARQGAWGLARLISLITTIVVAIVVAGILLVVLKANPANDIVKVVHDAARFLAGPFDGMFNLHNPRTEIAVNWGAAAIVYLLVGNFIAGALRR